MPLRHIPERTCVACRSLRPKREMVRIVRVAVARSGGTSEPGDGHSDDVHPADGAPMPAVRVDPTGKQSGRGAYMCRLRECWQMALRRKSLERALKTELSAADREALAELGEQQPVQRLSPVDAARAPAPGAVPVVTEDRVKTDGQKERETP